MGIKAYRTRETEDQHQNPSSFYFRYDMRTHSGDRAVAGYDRRHDTKSEPEELFKRVTEKYYPGFGDMEFRVVKDDFISGKAWTNGKSTINFAAVSKIREQEQTEKGISPEDERGLALMLGHEYSHHDFRLEGGDTRAERKFCSYVSEHYADIAALKKMGICKDEAKKVTTEKNAFIESKYNPHNEKRSTTHPSTQDRYDFVEKGVFNRDSLREIAKEAKVPKKKIEELVNRTDKIIRDFEKKWGVEVYMELDREKPIKIKPAHTRPAHTHSREDEAFDCLLFKDPDKALRSLADGERTTKDVVLNMVKARGVFEHNGEVEKAELIERFCKEMGVVVKDGELRLAPSGSEERPVDNSPISEELKKALNKLANDISEADKNVSRNEGPAAGKEVDMNREEDPDIGEDR